MRRTTAVVGSLVVHAVLAAALLSVERGDRTAVTPARQALELVDPAEPADVIELEVPPAPRAASGGGGPRGGLAGTPARVATREPTPAHRDRSRPVVKQVMDPGALHSDADPRGTMTIDPGGDAPGEGGGGHGAGGRGDGRGAGIGFGDGGGISALPPPAPPPAAPPVSKARPPRLIFPTRQHEVEDGATFVMRVTIDREGFVAGARLVHGFGGRRDEQASDLIWRFRYAPALDDLGRPIAATIDQPFLVQ